MDNELVSKAWEAVDILKYSSEYTADPEAENLRSVILGLLSDLSLVEKLARLAPELNMDNNRPDEVSALNNAMCELYEVVRKYRPTTT
jgi:hypothetical protein